MLVLGFSKGPSQAGELGRLPHNDIPYRKGRMQVGKILAHVGLLPTATKEELKQMVQHAIANKNGRFGWGSLIRCTVERFDFKEHDWVGSGGMIDQFIATPFGQQISTRCATRFLRELPAETKLIIMFGLALASATWKLREKLLKWLVRDIGGRSTKLLTLMTRLRLSMSNISPHKVRTYRTGLDKSKTREGAWASQRATLWRKRAPYQARGKPAHRPSA